MWKLLFQTSIGNMLFGAWLLGAFYQAKLYRATRTHTKTTEENVAIWLGVIFWPVPFIWDAVLWGIDYLKRRKK